MEQKQVKAKIVNTINPDMTVPNRDTSLLAPKFWTEMIQPALMEIEEQFGWIVELFEGVRSHERQQWLWDSGRTRPGKIITNALPGESTHQFGVGADLVAKMNGRWTWDVKQVPYDKFLGIYKKHGLRSLAPQELVHVEYTAPFRAKELSDFDRINGRVRLWDTIFSR
jgi:hypothetical protein